MLPPEEMWSSPHQSTGSDGVRCGARGAILPAGTSTALHRLLSGPLTSASSDLVILCRVGVKKVLFQQAQSAQQSRFIFYIFI